METAGLGSERAAGLNCNLKPTKTHSVWNALFITLSPTEVWELQHPEQEDHGQAGWLRLSEWGTRRSWSERRLGERMTAWCGLRHLQGSAASASVIQALSKSQAVP